MTIANNFSSHSGFPLQDAVDCALVTCVGQAPTDGHTEDAQLDLGFNGDDLSIGLGQFFDRLGNAKSENQLLKIATASIAQIVHADWSSLELTRMHEGQVEIASGVGIGGIPTNSRFSFSQSACEYVLIRDRCTVFDDLSNSAHPEHGILARQGFKHAIAVPVRHCGKTEGILTAAWKSEWKSKAAVQLQMSIFGRFLGASIERVRTTATSQKVLSLLKHEANHDSLTSLPNRNWFRNAMESEIQACKKTDSHFAVLFVDLDDFKSVNDCLSHQVGDELLKMVADRMRRELRSGDAVARIGGDEFVILFRNAPQLHEVKSTADRILGRIRQPFIIADKEVVVGGSLGVSYYPDHGQTADELLSNSDLAMYTAKQQGKNQCHVFSNEMATEAKENSQLKDDLELAISDSSLHFAFQPQRKIDSNELTSFEALIRWEHPKFGKISPSRFIPISENVGFVTQITELALRDACAAIAELRKLIPNAYVGVNISALDFVNLPMLIERVNEALTINKLPGSALELELTEGIFFNHCEAARHAIEVWHENGIKIAIDDFGTGFSSLQYLLDLEVDTLKIDKSFVSNIHENKRQQGIVKTILAMGDSFGCQCIAEGVEQQAELDCLKALGCTIYQGYFGGRPERLDTLIDIIGQQGSNPGVSNTTTILLPTAASQ